MNTPFYSLKTKTNEHCLEPLLDGSFYYAIYDLEQNLMKGKETIKKEDVIEFIYKKQIELKAKFEKKYPDEEKKTEEVESKENVEARFKDFDNEIMQEIQGFGMAKIKSSSKMPSSFIDLDELAMKGAVIIASVDKKTDQVKINAILHPEANIADSAHMTNLITDKVLPEFIKRIPYILESYICSSFIASKGGVKGMATVDSKEYQTYVDGFRESNTNLVLMKTILSAIQRAINSDSFKPRV